MESQPVIVDTDRELAEAVLHEGDERAFRELYRRHTPRLLALASRLLGAAGLEAEDAIQETWVRACQGLRRFRWDAAFATWLTGIAINVARDLLRRRGRSRVFAMEQPPEVAVRGIERDDRIDLEQSIALLPDGCRQVLVLHDIEGMKHREIALALGVSEGTSKSQLSAARRMIRAYLNP